jgi:hypothetical protein
MSIPAHQAGAKTAGGIVAVVVRKAVVIVSDGGGGEWRGLERAEIINLGGGSENWLLGWRCIPVVE